MAAGYFPWLQRRECRCQYFNSIFKLHSTNSSPQFSSFSIVWFHFNTKKWHLKWKSSEKVRQFRCGKIKILSQMLNPGESRKKTESFSRPVELCVRSKCSDNVLMMTLRVLMCRTRQRVITGSPREPGGQLGHCFGQQTGKSLKCLLWCWCETHSRYDGWVSFGKVLGATSFTNVDWAVGRLQVPSSLVFVCSDLEGVQTTSVLIRLKQKKPTVWWP